MFHPRPSDLFAFLLAFAATSGPALASSAHTYCLPQVADGQFAGGSIRTTFVLFNNARGAASVRLSLRDDDGGPLAVTIPELGTAADFEVVLDQGEVRFLATEANQAARAGSAEVRSDHPIGVSAIFGLSDPHGNFLAQSGIAVSPASASLRLPVDVSDRLNTGIAIRNLDAENPVNLTLTLRDAEGIRRGVPTRVTIPPAGHTARFASGELFPSLGVFQGSLELESDGPVSALALRQNSSPLSFTTLPVVPGDSTQVNFAMPQIANAAFARTTFVLFNLSLTEAAQVAIRLTGNDGEPFSVQLTDGQEGAEFEIAIPPAGTRFLSTNGLGDTGAGAARVTSNAPLGVAGIVTLVDGSGTFVGETGIGASPSLTKATIPVVGGTTQNGIALFNDNPMPALISVRFNEAAATTDRASGDLDFQASGPVELPPFGHLAVLVDQFALDVEGRTGSLAISSTLPVSGQTLLLRERPLAYTTLPVAEGIAATATAPALALSTLSEGVDLTADRVLDRELPGGFELSGGILPFGPFDRALGILAVRESDGRFFVGNVAPGPDRYRIVLPAGAYTLRTHYSIGEDGAFAAGVGPSPSDSWSDALRFGRFQASPGAAAVLGVSETREVVVDGDSLRNLRVPRTERRPVTGRVTGLEAIPAGLRAFPAILQFLPTDGATTSGNVMPAEDGSYRVELGEGRYSVVLQLAETDDATVPRVVQLADLPLGELNVTESGAAANFEVPQLVRVTGTVTSPYSSDIPAGAVVFAALEQTGVEILGSAYAPVSSNGAYRLTLARNRPYRFLVTLPLRTLSGQVSFSRPVNAPTETFSQDAVRNFTGFPPLPATVTLSGRVTGPSGPLADVTVTAVANGVSGAPDLNFGASTRTDADGHYTLPVLSGVNYFVTFSGR